MFGILFSAAIINPRQLQLFDVEDFQDEGEEDPMTLEQIQSFIQGLSQVAPDLVPLILEATEDDITANGQGKFWRWLKRAAAQIWDYAKLLLPYIAPLLEESNSDEIDWKELGKAFGSLTHIASTFGSGTLDSIRDMETNGKRGKGWFWKWLKQAGKWLLDQALPVLLPLLEEENKAHVQIPPKIVPLPKPDYRIPPPMRKWYGRRYAEFAKAHPVKKTE